MWVFEIDAMQGLSRVRENLVSSGSNLQENGAADLDEDSWRIILSKLPATEALGSFQLVCKAWHQRAIPTDIIYDTCKSQERLAKRLNMDKPWASRKLSSEQVEVWNQVAIPST